MHLTIHRPLVQDAAAHATRAGDAPAPPLPPPAPGREPRDGVRVIAARALARLAQRLDGETARRAVA